MAELREGGLAGGGDRLGPWETTATHNLLFKKPPSRSLERTEGKCENRSRGWGSRLRDLILNRFNSKKKKKNTVT